ncbi:putative phosphothreonine lyase domain-containing protein [Streptomyces sp. NPDC090088]|uniref:putative phosphothreonine lyase domain-containing protein n=1 Tax=Streptomyces sp. NPDC090088 TaxID=3365944 RepID=UPI0038122294
MRNEPTRTGQQPAKTPPPSSDTCRPWHWAKAPGDSLPAAAGASIQSGKWLWFLPVRALDVGWHLIKTAVEAGQLGPQAKVATLGNGFDGDPTRRPVIIYTADCNDEQDVRRVLLALRSLGVHDALAYKTDEATTRGEYGDRTSIYTSPAGTTKVIRRERQARPPHGTRQHRTTGRRKARDESTSAPRTLAAKTGGRGARPAASGRTPPAAP